MWFVVWLAGVSWGVTVGGSGMVADVASGTVVLASPDGEVVAVDTRGKQKWATKFAAMPLAVEGGQVLAVTDRTPTGFDVRVLGLDTGEVRWQCGAVTLPEWAPGQKAGLGTSLETWGYAAQGAFWVGWRAESHPVTGIQLPDEYMEAARKQASGGIRCAVGEEGTPREIPLSDLPDVSPVLPLALMVGTNGNPNVAKRVGDRVQSFGFGEDGSVHLLLHDPSTAEIRSDVRIGDPNPGFYTFTADGEHALVNYEKEHQLTSVVTGKRVAALPAESWGWSECVVLGNRVVARELRQVIGYGVDGTVAWTLPLFYGVYDGPYPP